MFFKLAQIFLVAFESAFESNLNPAFAVGGLIFHRPFDNHVRLLRNQLQDEFLIIDLAT
jgi:hypothetical protein